MAHTWQLHDVEDKLRVVVDAALTEGPQLITKSGVETAIVLSYEDYRKLLLPHKKLSDFFRESPLAGVDIDLARDQSPLRKTSVS